MTDDRDLVHYGPAAAADIAQLFERVDVGDLVVLGAYDPDSEEVAAFEELVGSHGGLGGDQTEAVLIVPASWPELCATGEALSGLQVHEALLGRLRQLGLRSGTDDVAEVAS